MDCDPCNPAEVLWLSVFMCIRLDHAILFSWHLNSAVYMFQPSDGFPHILVHSLPNLSQLWSRSEWTQRSVQLMVFVYSIFSMYMILLFRFRLILILGLPDGTWSNSQLGIVTKVVIFQQVNSRDNQDFFTVRWRLAARSRGGTNCSVAVPSLLFSKSDHMALILPRICF